jgi:RimJ/RimL family protein N-acetyltransferase
VLEKITLSGRSVRLEPLEERHLPGLALAVADGELWRLPVTTVPQPHELSPFLRAADAAYQAQKEMAFATVDIASGSVVGSTRFRNIELGHRRAEIGNTFIARSWQRSHVNTEAKFLMLRHAFEHLELNRVEFLTDFLNQASRTAIARLGAREEGVLRSHMVMRGGRIRDSVIFSIVREEWPVVKRHLEGRIGG